MLSCSHGVKRRQRYPTQRDLNVPQVRGRMASLYTKRAEIALGAMCGSDWN